MRTNDTLWPSQVGAFAYVVPLAPEKYGIIICIDLVLPMRWVDSPKFFCAFLETLKSVANYLVNTDLTVLAYGDISDMPYMGMGTPHTRRRFTNIDCYMYDVISVVKVGTE